MTNQRRRRQAMTLLQDRSSGRSWLRPRRTLNLTLRGPHAKLAPGVTVSRETVACGAIARTGRPLNCHW